MNPIPEHILQDEQVVVTWQGWQGWQFGVLHATNTEFGVFFTLVGGKNEPKCPSKLRTYFHYITLYFTLYSIFHLDVKNAQLGIVPHFQDHVIC